MGAAGCKRGPPRGGLAEEAHIADLISIEARASQYQSRVAALAQQAVASPPREALEMTLRRAIDFSYGGGLDWAPRVRVTVYADNPAEHQSNVPVYSTLLCAWGLPWQEEPNPRCRPVEGTDVQRGFVVASPFWSRQAVCPQTQQRVPYRAVAQQLLHWFLELPEGDVRKQLLVNMMLQLHEACYNCIGRHKEVFEFCVYDLIDAEMPVPASPSSQGEVARRVVQRHAGRFLDRFKRDALQAAVLSPLKFVFQNTYTVFENLDSHGASFWSSVFSHAFYPGLQMPYESIVEMDKGWTWGAVDFLPMMQSGDSRAALELFADPSNLGKDWRQLSAGLAGPRWVRRDWLPGLPMRFDESGFQVALATAKQPNSRLRRALVPYAQRFGQLFDTATILQRCALSAVSAVDWDAALGPSLATLSAEALGTDLSPSELRHRICGDVSDAGAIVVDTGAFAALLRHAGVDWAPAV